MKRFLATIGAIGSLAASTASWSKGDITKITIERVGSNDVVAISEREVLDRFVIWSGPGVVSWDIAKTIPQSDDAVFIVDWTQGMVARVPNALATYKVTMYVDRYDPPCNKYEVLYQLDDAGTQSFASSPAECPITTADPIGNDELLAFSPGKVVFKPGGAGFVDHDGALGIKWAFERLKPGRLFVGGRRLDAAAGPARAYIYDYGENGFQPIYLLFPTPGCWEISAGVGAAASPLTFVVLVEKIGDGPSWRETGPGPGRRVTNSWREE